MTEPKKPRKPRAALTHEQFFDLVEWLRATENTFTSYAAAARSASRHLGQEVSTASIKPAMEKAGLALAQPIPAEQQLRRDIASLADVIVQISQRMEIPGGGALRDRLTKIVSRNLQGAQ